MKIQYSDYKGQKQISDLGTIITSELSKSLHSGTIEALESEMTNVRKFLGTLTNILTEKKLLNEEDIKNLLANTMIDGIKLLK